MSSSVTDAAALHDDEEHRKLEQFMGWVREMLDRSDYLLPLAAGQRQFRQDNYNMASAALLEDLFFDAFGMFMRERHPRVELERRTGKELWDYGVDGLLLSHKEAVSTNISVWWTAGDRDPQSGDWVPKPELQQYTATHPIVFVYSGPKATNWTVGGDVDDWAISARTGQFLGTLGTRAITNAPGGRGASLVLTCEGRANHLLVDQIWRPEEWADLTFHDLWPVLGGPGIGTRDLWVDRSYANGAMGLGPVADAAIGAELLVAPDVLLPGIYVIPSKAMVDVPMIANNRAHSFDPAATQRILLEQRRLGNFVGFPTWYAHFAVAQPPNLYAKQREQYEALFAARRR